MADFWICPNVGKEHILKILFNQSAIPEELRLMQFIAGGPVTDASVVGDFTEAFYTGYSTIGIGPGDWDAPVIAANIGSVSKTVNPVFSCTSGSPQTVNGLLLYGADSDALYLGVNYATPIVMSPGTTDTITPLKIQDKTFA